MRPIQFGAQATLEAHVALPGKRLPEKFADLRHVQKAFDEFEKNVKRISPRRVETNHRLHVADEQHAQVVIDEAGARTEIVTDHNGAWMIPLPKGFQNTLEGWTAYFGRLFVNMSQREANLQTKEERVEQTLEASKVLISQIASGVKQGEMKVLGNPVEIRRKLEQERQNARPEPVTLDVQIGERVFSVTRRHDHGSLWLYEIAAKENPEASLTALFSTSPEVANDVNPVVMLQYKDEDNYRLDLEELHSMLSVQAEQPSWGYSEQEFDHWEKTRAQRIMLQNILDPMRKALIALDQQTRHYHPSLDRYEPRLHKEITL